MTSDSGVLKNMLCGVAGRQNNTDHACNSSMGNAQCGEDFKSEAAATADLISLNSQEASSRWGFD
jgi:hypothetical protein